jgi:ABC-type branched-subunit amino acid transport system permease subunit
MIISTLNWKRLAMLIVCLILALLPWAINPFRIRVFTLGGIYAIATTGLTLFMGFTGQISIGQAAFSLFESANVLSGHGNSRFRPFDDDHF